ncbi:unnamed protein product [Durusdinium trenchii]|uniref:Uncharacterized protein n=1 Tax=Durusdinium trenchii TaxID=1381693 RepID=A0ABP0N6U7_9DINO
MAPNAKQVKKQTKKDLPFPKAPLLRQPKDMRTRQLSNILAGLNYIRAPVVCTLVSVLFTVPGLRWDNPIDHLEIFAGKMSVTLAELQASQKNEASKTSIGLAGRRAVPIDLEIGGASMDLTTDIGSRGSTGRSVANPMGFGESCRIGNLLVSRTLVIMLICAAKCVWFCLEQPGTSIMELHTLFQRFIKIAALRKLKINMGDYGAPTLKPTILYSSHRAIDMLPNYTIRRQLVKKHMVKRYVDGNGKQRVCGGVDLKTSQAYPKHFGVALAACRSATAANRRLTAKRFLEVARRSSNEADGRRHIDKVWRDAAQLDSVIKFLTQRP